MPGNEGGDRVHNFFDQSSLSQDQRNTQFGEANWSGFHNNAWGANERQNGGPLNTNSKNNSGQQSEIVTGQNNQFSLASHGLSFAQSNVKNPSQGQQLNLNGFMHTPQAVNARQNEANFLGVDSGSDRHSMTARGLSFLESQQSSVPQHSNSSSFGGLGAPMNFNFLGGQPQMNVQQPGMLQSFPPQQSGTNDAQLMQQQAMFKQMQELQRRQQLQQFEAMQRNAMNHMPTFPNQSAGQHSQAINGNPGQDSSNFSWQSQVMGGATNWQQRGQPSAVQAYANGGMIHSEQGQPMRFTGLTPQQASQSLYGVPVSNSVGPNPFSQNSMDKPGIFHIPGPSGTFSGNPYAPHAEQVNRQDGSRASRSGSEGNTSFEHVSSQGLDNPAGGRGFNQVQQSKVSMMDGGRHGFVGGSEAPREKSPAKVAVPESSSAQAGGGLDPSEEKFLFGNDDNIWDAFGEASTTVSDGPDLFNKAPPVQNGTWSALMQSALAETSSGDGGTQDEWNGLESQNSKLQSSNQHHSISEDNEKSPPVWVDSSERDLLGLRTTNNVLSGNIATVDPNFSHNTNLQNPFSNIGSPIESQEGRRWLDSNSPKQHIRENRVLENPNSSRDVSKIDTGFWNHQQGAFLPQSAPDPNVNSKVEPSLRNVNINQEFSQRPRDNHNRDLWNQINFSSKSGNVDSGNGQHNMSKGQSAINSSVNSTGGRVAEMQGIRNSDGREISNDSRQESFPNHHASPGFSNENVWSDTGRGVPVSRKFQFHPMGDVDLSTKDVLNSPSIFPSSGFKAHEAQPPLVGSRGSSLSNMDKDRVSGFHGGLSGNVHSGFSPNLSAPFARPGEKPFANQQLPPSQNMLELLHKVDQSTDQKAIFNLGSSTPHHTGSSDIPSGGQIGPAQSHPSPSHSFNLQLAPPSQGINFSNRSDLAPSFLRSVGSSSSQLVSSEKGDNSNAWLASDPSAHSLPPSNRPHQVDSKDDKSRGLDSSLPNMKGIPSTPMASNSTYLRSPFQNQHMSDSGRQMMDHHQSSTLSSDRHAYQDPQSTTDNQSGMRNSMHQAQPSPHAVMGGMGKDNVSSSGLYSRTSQQQLGGHARNPSNFMKSHFQSNDSSNMNSFSQKKDGVDGSRSADPGSSPVVADGLFGMPTGVSREESLGRRSMESSPSATSQKDADVIHHTLKPNNMAYNSYMHEMQATQTMGLEPSYRESKRLRGPENGSDVLQTAGKVADPSTGGMYGMVTDPSVSQAPVSSENAKMVRFNSQSGNRNVTQLPHGAVASRDTPSSGHSDPQTHFTGRPQLTGISPQMASSWFHNFETSQNGQPLPLHNVPRIQMENNVQQKFIKPPSNLFPQNAVQLENAVINTDPIANTSQLNTYSGNENMSSLHALIPHVSSPSPVHVRPKKRKTATSDLIPWNKEIGESFRRIQNTSSAEFDWAQSSNRLVERGGDESDPHEDMSAMIRPRRRLILTTKFMQQIFCPPPASILSLDARSNYEVIMYSIARLALGDACNLICGVESDSPPDNGNSLSENVKTSGSRDQIFSKIMEDFTNKAKELDNELLRLDKRASILDFRLDCQDLERFSVINRFAKFHGRSQADVAESSSSSDANAVSQKPCQRYVTAHPMPKTFPERVQCLSL